MRVLLLTASLGDGAGGGGFAVRTWAETLTKLGAVVSLGCLDLSAHFGKTCPTQNAAIDTHEFAAMVEPFTRLILAPGLYRRLDEVVREFKPDIIHANGIWSPMTRTAASIARKRKIALVVSPHGHVEPWAMANGSLKKRLAWAVYGRRSVADAAVVQAATDGERAALLARGVTNPIAIVPNIVPQPAPGERGAAEPIKTALFLSRIHPSKGVADLVDAWSGVPTEGWRLIIAGPDEVGFVRNILQKILVLGLTNVEYVGPIDYDKRWQWYGQATLSILPTYSENFGIAIGEALAAGVPVITTTAAPWPAIRDLGLGWWVEPGVNPLKGALTEALTSPSERLQEMGRAGRAFVEKSYAAEAVGQRLLSLYEQAISLTGSKSRRGYRI